MVAVVAKADEKILEKTIQSLRLEKQRVAVQKAHYGELMHRDGTLAKRQGRKPDRSIVKAFMNCDGEWETLDHELRFVG